MHKFRNINTSLLTIMHLLVDGLCACCMTMLMLQVDLYACFLLFLTYNTLAFVTQPFTGLWTDRTRKAERILSLATACLVGGAILTLIVVQWDIIPYEWQSTLIVTLSPTIFLGMGNSMFHVYGGKYVTRSTSNDIRHMGIFVSSGALGLVLGQTFFAPTTLIAIAVVLCILDFVVRKRVKRESLTEKGMTKDANFIAETRNESMTGSVAKGLKKIGEKAAEKYSAWASPKALLVFILLIVFGRSFMGKMVPSSENTTVFIIITLGAVAMLGKAMGGYIARHFGMKRTLTVSLVLSSVLLMLASYHIGFTIAAVWCINCSMPITLHLANRLYPGREGFAFGLLAAVLIPGFLLAMLYNYLELPYSLLYALLGTIVIEALMLMLMRERSFKVLAASVVINICTNVPLNILAIFVDLSIPAIIALELSIVVIEALAYTLVVHDFRRALRNSLVCNTASYIIGLLFQFFYTLIMYDMFLWE